MSFMCAEVNPITVRKINMKIWIWFLAIIERLAPFIDESWWSNENQKFSSILILIDSLRT